MQCLHNLYHRLDIRYSDRMDIAILQAEDTGLSGKETLYRGIRQQYPSIFSTSFQPVYTAKAPPEAIYETLIRSESEEQIWASLFLLHI